MRERPINLRDWEVRAILDGRKTQTRRPVKPLRPPPYEIVDEFNAGVHWLYSMNEDGDYCEMPCPFGAPGDRLWVRECHGVTTGRRESDLGAAVRYRADGEILAFTMPAESALPLRLTWEKWRPSIHMPRWASRLTLRVTDVRVERAQDITPEDAVAEGVFGEGRYAKEAGTPYPVATFAQLWRDAYGAESWTANPWVWCVSFERAEVRR